MNLTRSHMTIFSSTYKSQMMVKVKFVNSVKYQSVTITMKRREYYTTIQTPLINKIIT